MWQWIDLFPSHTPRMCGDFPTVDGGPEGKHQRKKHKKTIPTCVIGEKSDYASFSLGVWSYWGMVLWRGNI